MARRVGPQRRVVHMKMLSVYVEKLSLKLAARRAFPNTRGGVNCSDYFQTQPLGVGADLVSDSRFAVRRC